MQRLALRRLAIACLLLPPLAVKSQGTPATLPTTMPRTTLEPASGSKIPWSVVIYPSAKFVAIGNCQAVSIDLIDESRKDVPRNLLGQRIGLADFDWTATGKRGDAAVGVYDSPNNWKVCACQAAVVGTTINISAQYPARALKAKATVPEVAFRASIELPVVPAYGTTNPKGCEALASSPVAVRPSPAAIAPRPAAGAGAPTLAPPIGAPATEPSATRGPSRSDVPHPAPVNPNGFVATLSAPSTVALSWQPVPGISFYQLWGPGIQNTGVSVTGTSYTVTNVPAGAGEWTIGSYFLPGPTSTVTSAFTKARLDVPAIVTTGHYRIVANGFRVLHETKDDILSRDGKGDEVYGAFTMFHFDRRTGALLDRDLRRTKTIGDVYNFADRLKGGSWSATGGFKAGDKYPDVTDPSRQYGQPSRDSFPFLIWDGSLSDAQDALIILPTVWEYDGGSGAYDQWFQHELADAHGIWSDVGVQEMLRGTQLGVVLPSGQLVAPGGVATSAASTFQTMLLQMAAMFGVTPFDRPIGMRSVGGTAVLPRRAIVITREIIEASLQRLAGSPVSVNDALDRSAAALNELNQMIANMGTSSSSTSSSASGQPNAGMPYGTIGVPLIDGQGPDLQGQYVLYIQVERVEGTSSPLVH